MSAEQGNLRLMTVLPAVIGHYSGDNYSDPGNPHWNYPTPNYCFPAIDNAKALHDKNKCKNNRRSSIKSFLTHKNANGHEFDHEFH